MKVYVTKYTLTRGLFEFDVRESTADSRYVRAYDFGFFGRLGRDCFTDRAEATADARKRAMREVDKLRERLRCVEALVDEPKWEG